VEVEPIGMGETWLGDGVVSVREAGRTVIVNLHDDSLTYVNHDDRSYVVAPLPLDLDAVLIPEVRGYVLSNVTSGRVLDTGRTTRLLGRPCREFQVESWGVGAGRGSQPVVFSVWACNQVPADLHPFRVFLHCARQLHARDESYSQELLKMDGLQLRLQRDVRDFPFRIRTVDEAVEMEMRQTPQGVYDPPAGYTRRERIAQI
jgi:hypothetical protein